MAVMRFLLVLFECPFVCSPPVTKRVIFLPLNNDPLPVNIDIVQNGADDDIPIQDVNGLFGELQVRSSYADGHILVKV